MEKWHGSALRSDPCGKNVARAGANHLGRDRCLHPCLSPPSPMHLSVHQSICLITRTNMHTSNGRRRVAAAHKQCCALLLQKRMASQSSFHLHGEHAMSDSITVCLPLIPYVCPSIYLFNAIKNNHTTDGEQWRRCNTCTCPGTSAATAPHGHAGRWRWVLKRSPRLYGTDNG